MDQQLVVPMILATSALTFGIRYLPMALLRGERLRPKLERFLRALPIGILCALVAQSVFLKDGVLVSGTSNYYLHGLVAILLVAIRTRHVAAMMVTGFVVVGLLTFLLRP